MGDASVDNRHYSWLEAVARLAPGVVPERVGNEATILHRRGRADLIEGGQYDPEASVVAAPLLAARGPLASRESLVARWLAAVSLLALVIACANVRNVRHLDLGIDPDGVLVATPS